MRLILALCFLCAAAAHAGTDILTYNLSGIGTSATAVVETKINVEGVPLLISMTGSTNMSFSVATVSGYGMSAAGARTVLAEVTNAMAVATNPVSDVYLKEDRLAVSCYSAAGTNSDHTAQIRILVERP
jgi:hypothetical protein